MSVIRRHAERVINPFGRTVLGPPRKRWRHGYRLHRIGQLPDQYASLQAHLWEPFTVPIRSITTSAGFSYASDGWHPYLAALDESLAEPGLPYERSILRKYYAAFQPQTVMEVLMPDREGPLRPLDEWPPVHELFALVWAVTPSRLRSLLSNADSKIEAGRRQELGPQSDEFGRQQVSRVVAAFESIRSEGFEPWRFRDGALTGFFLAKGDRFRFLVTHGNHRLPALLRLGIDDVPVRFDPAHPPVVNHAELSRWSEGSRSILTAEAADAFFQAQFESTGRTKARHLGLVD